jgi:alkylmercury lyase
MAEQGDSEMQTAITQDKQSAFGEENRETVARMFIEAFPGMDAGDQELALALYRLLAEGQPVSPTNLAGALNRPVEDLEHTLNQWPAVFYDGQGCIIGFWGLSVRETKHRLEVNGSVIYAWCAWDTLWLPELLHASVAVTSRCAQTGDPVRLNVLPERVDSAEPVSTVVSFLELDERAPRENNVVTSFCHFVHFFRDREEGERWTERHPETFLLTLDEAFDIGRRVNATRYRDILQPMRGSG